jgi:hypothetical protein
MDFAKVEREAGIGLPEIEPARFTGKPAMKSKCLLLARLYKPAISLAS